MKGSAEAVTDKSTNTWNVLVLGKKGAHPEFQSMLLFLVQTTSRGGQFSDWPIIHTETWKRKGSM